ncbi:poly-beta-1,6-N-acetyl-D-glucosamine synthase [Oleiagrimonas sp.]|jgi:biofilm PGA synthesis N-glycosyltransferase PgaC|uniref:poly-beta-1,6-N-acetyl-D-glucosamine synthase n=1 Tax=Oleiagrimonas sp. TaxID=2010330 RepID=UPI0026078D61|nr:poly-beta-1,6-N-acetyl-D-glucosamine synthase [Oleiagrimonas sp.]MDA3914920.1 poly-beta-1,6-N-acetyl-D-glucosamine synthase [Oleiagrimonas sp.]
MHGFSAIKSFLLAFAFYYPLIMSMLWMSGSLLYYFRRERKRPPRTQPHPLPGYPPLSVIVPCHNEGRQVRETILQLKKLKWPEFEIIAINDGSTDDTGELLEALLEEVPQLRVLHFSSNQGKATGLRMGALAARHEYLICIDGDALLDEYAGHWMMPHFLASPRVGAVTGNPRIRNRSTLLGKLQVGEFSSIIGLIKRAQRTYGRIFTVSGVITAFRKRALQDAGYWHTDMVTEDIDISWQLQLRHWDIRYEPNALCWLLTPETLRGLWRQRLRWAQGGCEVMLRYAKQLPKWRMRRMWGVPIEYLLSVLWAYCMLAIIVLWILGKFVPLPPGLQVPTMIPHWHGVILGLTCLLQFLISLVIDRRYETRIGRNYYWMIWYPVAYWLINTFTTVVAVPKALLRKRKQRVVWVSPDRGNR